jgi:hypothetical protein
MANAIGVVAITGAPCALAEHVATCVTVRWDLNLGLGKPFTDQPLLEVQ